LFEERHGSRQCSITMSYGFSIGDFITVPQYAWNVYKACRDSSSDFKELSNEVKSLHTVLSNSTSITSRGALSVENAEALSALQKNCFDVLTGIQTQLDKYKSLGTRKKRLRDRLRWAAESVSDVRMRLISNTTELAAFNSSLSMCVGLTLVNP